MFLDAIRVKIRDEGPVRNKAIHVAIGVRADGAKFRLRVLNELKNRGVDDLLLAVADGLKGFPEAIAAAYPETIVQTCIVPLLRHGMEFASWKDRKAIPFFAFPRAVRRLLSTTNAIEALNSKLRRAVRARGHFPNDQAALKLQFLVLNRAGKDWKMPPREWTAAKAQMAVIFGERFAKAMTA